MAKSNFFIQLALIGFLAPWPSQAGCKGSEQVSKGLNGLEIIHGGLEILSDVTEGTALTCANSMTVAGLGTLAASSTSLSASCGSGIAQGLPRFEARLGTCHIARPEFGATVALTFSVQENDIFYTRLT